jgi:hypothetical protein
MRRREFVGLLAAIAISPQAVLVAVTLRGPEAKLRAELDSRPENASPTERRCASRASLARGQRIYPSAAARSARQSTLTE